MPSQGIYDRLLLLACCLLLAKMCCSSLDPKMGCKTSTA